MERLVYGFFLFLFLFRGQATPFLISKSKPNQVACLPSASYPSLASAGVLERVADNAHLRNGAGCEELGVHLLPVLGC